MWLLLCWFAVVFATTCVPKEDKTYEQCAYYEDNDDWLPPRYIVAASCICSDDSLNSSEMNCVRSELQELHDDSFSKKEKQEARDKLTMMNNETLSKGAYESWSVRFFLDKITSIHRKSYKDCCCPGTIAPNYMWEELFYHTPPCMMMRMSQKTFSNCFGWF